MSNLDVLKARVKAAEGHMVPTLVVATVELRELLDELDRLSGVEKPAAFKLDDIVREVGEEENTGKIVQIKESSNGTAYVVELFKPYPKFNTVIYYEDEIELRERKDGATGT